MEFKLNERSQKLVQKLKKEGLLDTFLQSLQKKLRNKMMLSSKNINLRSKDKEQELIRQIKADPEKVLL